MAVAAAYRVRKEASAETGECLRSGCADPAADGSAYCGPHRDAQRAHDRAYRRRRRKRCKRLGLCRDCEAALKSGERIWCTEHRIRRNRITALPKHGVESVVEKPERIAARTVKEADGRTRYRGQRRRGQQTHAQLNLQDLAWANASFDAFAAGVQLLSCDEAKEWPRGERDRVRAATANQGERTAGHMDDILERLGHFKQRHARREGE